MLKYKALVLGELQTNCYLAWNDESKEAVVIDPADDGVTISEELEQSGLKLKGILLTHGHFDHSLGVIDLKLIYEVPIYMNMEDDFLIKRQKESGEYFLGRKLAIPKIKKIDKDLGKIKKIKLGDEIIEIIKCPGHSPGSVSLYNKENNLLFSGDTLFNACRGRTDFKYSSTEDIFKSLDKLTKLPENTLVLPGHGDETTVGVERERYKNF
jgi:hydroxyacylglutathione hydrolase